MGHGFQLPDFEDDEDDYDGDGMDEEEDDREI
jgi:hypothetical protein